jgi:hypothetical protein
MNFENLTSLPPNIQKIQLRGSASKPFQTPPTNFEEEEEGKES